MSVYTATVTRSLKFMHRCQLILNNMMITWRQSVVPKVQCQSKNLHCVESLRKNTHLVVTEYNLLDAPRMWPYRRWPHIRMCLRKINAPIMSTYFQSTRKESFVFVDQQTDTQMALLQLRPSNCKHNRPLKSSWNNSVFKKHDTSYENVARNVGHLSS